MGQRIRYIKEGDNLRSVRFIQTSNGEAMVYINPNIPSARIDVGDNHYIVGGSSLHKVKIAIKEMLITLGATFEEEKRKVNEE